MKIHKVFTALFCLLICLLNLCACTKKDTTKDYEQQLNLVESVENFLNPDRGFYRTAVIKMTESSVEDKSYIIRDDFQLYHLRIDISSFSTNAGGSDSEFTSASLLSLDNLINKFENQNKNVILRFAYDSGFDGNSNFEPSTQLMLKHIEQLSSVINKYSCAITAVEVGLVGPWGEMHTSTKANKEVINSLIDKFLSTTTSASILVRTPKMIYDYLGLSLDTLSSFTYSSSASYSRLGFFNDGYLGSESDLGTYSNREKEIEFIKNFTNLNPFGGEVTRPTCELNNFTKSTVEEMHKLNLTYLNYEWHDEITQTKWQTQSYTSLVGDHYIFYNKSAYHYIACNMGYRLKLNSSVFTYSNNFDTFSATLDFENIGFGNLTKQKTCSLLFVKEGQVVKKSKLGNFETGKKLFSADISSLEGEVEVYLSLSGQLSNGSEGYFVRLCNTNYSSTLNANYVGKLNIIR